MSRVSGKISRDVGKLSDDRLYFRFESLLQVVKGTEQGKGTSSFSVFEVFPPRVVFVGGKCTTCN